MGGYDARHEFAWTYAKYSRTGDQLKFEVRTHGSYPGMPLEREYMFLFLTSKNAKLASVNGTTMSPILSWLDGTLSITISKQPVATPFMICLELISSGTVV